MTREYAAVKVSPIPTSVVAVGIQWRHDDEPPDCMGLWHRRTVKAACRLLILLFMDSVDAVQCEAKLQSYKKKGA